MTLQQLIPTLVFGTLILSFSPAMAQESEDPVPQESPAQTPEPVEDIRRECGTYVPPEEQDDPNLLALRGVACFEEERFLDALVLYRQAYQYSRSPLLKAAIGRALQELDLPYLSRDYFQGYLLGRPDDSEGNQRIRTRLDNVEAQLQEYGRTVSIRTSPSGALVHVVIEGRHWESLGVTPLEVTLTPREYELVVQKPGYFAETVVLEVDEKDSYEIDLSLVAEGSTFDMSNRSWRRTGGWLMILSIPALGAGTTLFFLGANDRSAAADYDDLERKEALLDSAILKQRIGIISASVGATALLSGIVFYIIGRDRPQATLSLMPLPTFGDGQAAATWIWQF